MTIRYMMRTYGPYVFKPLIWPEIIRRIVTKQSDSVLRKREREKSIAWCRKQAISVPQALKKLKLQILNFERVHKLEVKLEKQTEKKCPMILGRGGNLDLLYSICEGISASATSKCAKLLGKYKTPHI